MTQEIAREHELRQEVLFAAQGIIDSTEPLLIGVRHHSAVVARAIPQMLDAFRPECVLVELPSDLQDWIPFVGHEETVAPIALSVVTEHADSYFYPLADFSPELVALRWAKQNAVPVVCCDLSIAHRQHESKSHVQPDTGEHTPYLDCVLRLTSDGDSGALWQRMVESPGAIAPAENVRDAALRFGWMVRANAEVSGHDLRREAAMREAIRRAPKRSAAVVGAFHAAALVPEAIVSAAESDALLMGEMQMDGSAGVSLIPYSFEQLDQRSGYPAGILDPQWHQAVIEAKNTIDLDNVVVDLATDVCRQLRRDGFTAGTPDATEIVRMTRDLARLRGLDSPGRGEFVEALESCLVQGDLLGRGRAVASASFSILVGDRQGSVTKQAPKCGLVVALERQLQQLGLPGADTLATNAPRRTGSGRLARIEDKELRLDVLRNPRDRARSVVLSRMCAAGIPYAKRVDEGAETTEETKRGRENLTQRWSIAWQQATAATIASLARYGTTLEQVVMALVRRESEQESELQSVPAELPATILNRLATAATCGLPEMLTGCLNRINGEFRSAASLAELVFATSTLRRIAAGHLPGVPTRAEDAFEPHLRFTQLGELGTTIDDLFCDCFARLDDIIGSTEIGDVSALNDLLALIPSDDDDWLVGRQQVASWCRRTSRDGSDLMAGASTAALQLLGATSPEQFVATSRSWVDSAASRTGRQRLRQSLCGATQVLLSQMQSDARLLDGVSDGIAALDDDRFLERLPSLRGAFQMLAPMDRQRLLDTQLSQLDAQEPSEISSSLSSEQIATFRQADLAGRRVLEQDDDLRTVLDDSANSLSNADADSDEVSQRQTVAPGQFSLADRWRLVLGTPPESQDDRVRASARSLDDLYGRSRGEGSRDKFDRRASGRGGTERPRPTTLQWADELEMLFGSDVCQEVLGQSAAGGNAAAVTLLDPDTVTPSVDLLRQVLRLAGAVPESKTEQLRKLASRITEQLAEQLAVRLQPATHGLATARPTRRRSSRLDLRRTIRENLRRCRRDVTGRNRVIAENLVFNAHSRRSMDWHLTFVVDVSGSMDASVIYSALVAAIFGALPAITVRFLAFSTEVIDLSGQVGDPLSLLLGVQVGGGTDIGLGLRAARAGINVPTRSLCVLVSDFEEGVSIGRMLSEVRELVQCGVKCLGLAALDDAGSARFNGGIAQMVASAGMPVAAVSPDRLAAWVGEQIRNA